MKIHYIAAVGFSEYTNCEHRLPDFLFELTQLFLRVTNGCYASSQLNGTHYLAGAGRDTVACGPVIPSICGCLASI